MGRPDLPGDPQIDLIQRWAEMLGPRHVGGDRPADHPGVDRGDPDVARPRGVGGGMRESRPQQPGQA